MKNLKQLTPAELWWNQLGSLTKLIFARRHYPATHVDWLTPVMIEDIHQKEKIK